MGSLGNALMQFWEWEGVYSQRYKCPAMHKVVPQKEAMLPQIPCAPQGASLHLGDIDLQNIGLAYGGFNCCPQESCQDPDKHPFHLPNH